MDEMFFKCGFCGAQAPKGKHVCGDRFTVVQDKYYRERERHESRPIDAKAIVDGFMEFHSSQSDGGGDLGNVFGPQTPEEIDQILEPSTDSGEVKP